MTVDGGAHAGAVAPVGDPDAGLHDLPDAMHTTPRMAAIFSGTARVRRMLDFEAALAAAQSRAGIVPPEAARAIVDAADALTIDVGQLARDGAVAGTIAVPVVAALRDAVPGDARRYVHFGATSQDVIDTAAVLQMRDGLAVLIDDLVGVGDACVRLCREHRDTPMAGRTLLQQAVPVTFGLKAAGWLAATTRNLQRLRAVQTDLALQFGGAAGTLASLGGDGLRIAELLADELDLALPGMPWHTDRTRVAEVGAALAIAVGAMTKVARDVVLLSQTEVAEAAESTRPGKGRSSAMPQKRNPVDTMAVLASGPLAAAQAGVLLGGMAHEHERAIGNWQAEWTAIPALFRLAASAVSRIRAALAEMTVDPARMRANLDSPDGQPMAESLATALAASMGKPAAYDLVTELSGVAGERRASLLEVARGDDRIRAVLSEDDLQQALDPRAYLGSAGAFVDRALDDYAAARPTQTGSPPGR